jgi:hypothetical protein
MICPFCRVFFVVIWLAAPCNAGKIGDAGNWRGKDENFLQN